MSHPRTGARILIDTQVAQGTDLVFGVPGESYLAVLDALRDSPIRFITTRQEGGAAFMADAYGKLTGRPGICRHARAGCHQRLDRRPYRTPMILFIGQVGNDYVEREAFQEIDCRRMFFAALARAYGAHGETVDTTALFAPVLRHALAHIGATDLPALIELRYDTNLITPNTTLEAIRNAAQAPHSAPGAD